MRGIRFLYLTICLLLLSSCSNSSIYLSPVSMEEGEIALEDNHVHSGSNKSNKELIVWSHFDTSATDEYFKSAYPGVKVISRIIDFGDILDTYNQAYLTGNAPDVLVFDGSQIGNLNGIDTLEDLSQEQYNAKEYIDKIPDKYYSVFSSFGGHKLLGIPLDLTSALLYYRQDLLEENGFPSEPEELADYLEDSVHWIEMAKELKKKEIYIFQYATDSMDITSMAYSMFDEHMQFNRAGHDYEKALSVSREVRRSGLELRSSIWDASGQEALRNGKLAMIVMGSWATSTIMDWAPELNGKWRAAELPLGLAGYESGSAAGISKSSNNKEMAWNYIKLMTTILDPHIEKSNEGYLGGQDIYSVIQRNIEKSSSLFPSPIDKQLQDEWNSRVNQMIESDRPISDVLTESAAYMELISGADRVQLKKFVTPNE